MRSIHEIHHSSPVYDSANRGLLAVEEVREVFKYRALIFQLIRRDLISRYKRSFLGIAWTMLNPLGTMLILALVFSRLFQATPDYPVYVLSALIAWAFFSQTITAALRQNVWGGSLLQRIYLPRTTFTISAVGTGLINLLISLVPLAVIMLAFRFPFHRSLLFLPISIFILVMFTLGFALLFSTLAIYFPDVVEMIQVGLGAWMYLTPIIYPVEILTDSMRRWLLPLNPMYYFLEIVRLPIYEGVLPSVGLLVPGCLISFASFMIGWFVFTWKANELTYRT